MGLGLGLTVGQVGRQVWHHVAADQLPPEVIILTLAVLTLVQIVVLLEGAARCGQTDTQISPGKQLLCPQKPSWDGCCRTLHNIEVHPAIPPHSHSCKHRSKAAPCLSPSSAMQ